MTQETIPILLSSEDRKRLGRVADVLIPGGAGLPSASDAGITTEPIDRVIAADHQLAALLAAVVRSEEPPESIVAELRTGPTTNAEVFAVSGAYFMVPQVRRGLGYPSIAPRRPPPRLTNPTSTSRTMCCNPSSTAGRSTARLPEVSVEGRCGPVPHLARSAPATGTSHGRHVSSSKGSWRRPVTKTRRRGGVASGPDFEHRRRPSPVARAVATTAVAFR